MENYNGHSGRKIPRSGNFFRFVAHILTEEQIKSREFRLLIASGGGTKSRESKKYEVFHFIIIQYVHYKIDFHDI